MQEERVKKVVEKALEYVELGWTQESYARDKKNNPVSPYVKEACKFCPTGAIRRAAWESCGNEAWSTSFWKLVSEAHIFVMRSSINSQGKRLYASLWMHNDESERTKAEIVALFRKVLAA